MSKVADEIRQAKFDLERLVDEYLEVKPQFDQESNDELREQVRVLKHRINIAYWSVIFSRLQELVLQHEERRLSFTEADGVVFNFGWIDDRMFSRETLLAQREAEGEEYEVQFLTEWLRAQDLAFMQFEQRERLAEEVAEARAEMERLARKIAELRRHRENLLPGRKDQEFLDDYMRLENAQLQIYMFEKLKKKRSLNKDEVTRYISSRSSQSRDTTRVSRSASRVSQNMAEVLEETSREISSSTQRISDLQDRLAELKVRQDRALARDEELKAERRNHIEERLREIREDIRFCSRWGQTDYYSVLFEDRSLHTKDEVVESIRRVEDFDPTLFRNKKVERSGKPSIVLTPGTGNGSYDFRSNTLIIPVTAPRSLLESLAFAFSLYRRDVDKETNEAKLWDSFFHDNVWRAIKEREKPVRYKDRMREFVNSYRLWVTKESHGLMVLNSELRKWFERHIAPDKRSVMIPRALRGLRMADRPGLIEELRGAQEVNTAYALTVLLYLDHEFEEALRVCDDILARAPEKAEVFWNRGILFSLDDRLIKDFQIRTLKKMRYRDRLTEARKSFEEFIKLDSQSWWSLKAQEHVRRLAEQISQLSSR